jgi:hypothetical protein
MMRGICPGFCVVVALCVSSIVAHAQDGAPSKAEKERRISASRETSGKVETSPSDFFGKPVVFRGTLGDTQVQVAVRLKAVADEGLEGDYFIFGRSQKILLAGELDGDKLFLEESENGINISGYWEGTLQQGGSIEGNWTSVDGKTARPFSLTPVKTPVNVSVAKPVRKVPTPASARSVADR